MTHEQYLDRFRGTAIRRAKHWMLQRNAAVVLGNTGDAEAIDALERTLSANEHPIVRGHAAWAIGQIGRRTGNARAAHTLREALVSESNDSVRQEISMALTDLDEGAVESRR